MVRTLGLTHMALTVSDLERTLRFYQQAFGSRVLYQTGDKAEINTPGAQDVITLIQTNQPPPGEMVAVTHFGFRLHSPEDIDDAVADIEKAGGTITERGEFEPGAPYVFLKDPDGYVIEVWYERTVTG